MKKGLKEILATGAIIAGLSLTNPIYARAENNDYLKSPVFKNSGIVKTSRNPNEWTKSGKSSGIIRIKNDSYSWTKGEKVFESLWEGLNLIDWYTTREEIKRGMIETNKLLGKTPSISEIDKYFAFWAIAHPIVTNYLPRHANTLGIEWNPKLLWQSMSISVSGLAAISNLSKMNSEEPIIKVKYSAKF